MRLTLLFLFSFFLSTGVFAQSEGSGKFMDEVQALDLRVFPNPTTDSFMVVDNLLVNEIVLYNIIGRKVKSFEFQNKRKYSLAELPDGMYFVSLISLEDGVLKTVRISKRAMRP